MGRGGGDGARRGQRGNGTAEQPEQPFNARGARDAKGTQERGRFQVKGLRLKVRKRGTKNGFSVCESFAAFAAFALEGFGFS